MKLNDLDKYILILLITLIVLYLICSFIAWDIFWISKDALIRALYLFISLGLLGYIFIKMSKKHKYEVKFYKSSRISRFICTRTYVSTVKFAVSRFCRGYGLFTIKRIK